MGAINPSSAAITSIFKYYHTDKTNFYPTVSTADEYAHEIYVVTEHSAVRCGSATPNHNAASIIRIIQSSGGVLKTHSMLSPVDSGVLSLTGSGTAYFSGDFARLGNNVYYSSYHNNVTRIIPRISAGDTVSKTAYPAGVPDPNASKIINKMDDTDDWTYASEAGGDGSISKDISPLHKYWGEAGISFTQLYNGFTSTITYTATTAFNLEKFDDGTTSAPSDYIYFSVYRFAKDPIAELKIELSTGGFTGFYYWAPMTMTAPDTLDYTAESSNNQIHWDAYSFQQNTVMGEWGRNKYDNQMFRFRIAKKSFAYSGTYAGSMWSAIKSIRFSIKGNARASASSPAKVTIADLRLVKCPPTPVPYRIQWLSFDEIECGMSTEGWFRDSGAGTKSTFNRHLAKEGVSCLEIPQPATTPAISTTPVATLNFSTPRNFVVFADGVTATNSHVLKMNICSHGIGNNTSIGANWVSPKIRFYSGGEGSGDWAEVKFGLGSVLRGGGVERAVQFNTGLVGGQWTTNGSIDWTAVNRVEIFGQQNQVTAKFLGRYYIDNLRLERPTARKIVNAFEPVDLLLLDTTSKFAEAGLNANAVGAINIAKDVMQWFLKWTKYKTHGYGYAVYPDYEHGQGYAGFSSLRLIAHGSTAFGMLIQVDPNKVTDRDPLLIGHDLSQFTIPVWKSTPTWSWPTDFGHLSFSTITASDDDEFSIWIASDTSSMSHIKEVVIKFHGNDGSNNADEANAFEYRIEGVEIKAALQKQLDKAKEIKEMQAGNKALWGTFKDGEWANILAYSLNPDTKNYMQELVSRNVEYWGIDKGGWPSAVFKWRKRDMLMQTKNSGTVFPSWSDIRGQTIELVGDGSQCAVAVDNLTMKTKGALSGTYFYKMMIEDRDGKLSPASDASQKIIVSDADVQLEDLYVPSVAERNMISSKRLYRIGGSSTEWRLVASIDKDKTSFIDKTSDFDLGAVMPADFYAPPKAKIIKAINNCMYYGNVVTRFNEVLPYRLYKSEPYCAYRVNEFDEIDLPETKGAGLTAIEGYYNSLIIWTSDSMWSCDLGLSSPPVFRHPEGCIAKRSVVVSDRGLIWLSKNGLMIGDMSRIDENFFRPINNLFDSYTEIQLENAIGFLHGNYYYLFYDNGSSISGYHEPKGICCYLPERQFSEIRGNAFNVYSAFVCSGDSDNDIIYYGRGYSSIGTGSSKTPATTGLFQMFSGDKDNETSITTQLRSKDFSEPGIAHDKFLSTLYIAGANMYSAAANTTANLTPFAYCNQTSVDTMPVISAGGSTAVRAWAAKAIQGDWGQFLGFGINGTNRHKIVEMTMKIEPEQDTEYHA